MKMIWKTTKIPEPLGIIIHCCTANITFEGKKMKKNYLVKAK